MINQDHLQILNRLASIQSNILEDIENPSIPVRHLSATIEILSQVDEEISNAPFRPTIPEEDEAPQKPAKAIATTAA